MSELNHQLLNACRYGHVKEVTTKINKGADINYEDWDDPFRCTPLSEACRCGNAAVVKLLLSMGADPNEPISYGITPIHLACERGHCDVLQILLNFGKNRENNNNNNSNNSSNGNSDNNLESEEKIHEHKNNNEHNFDNENKNDDSNSASYSNYNLNSQSKKFQYLINPLPTELFNMDTPLHLAAANDHANICRMLVTLGDNVDINVQNRTGDTPLHVCVANDRFTTVEVLLQLGANLCLKNYAGMSVYSLAKIGKCKQSLKAIRPFIAKLKLRRKQQRERLLNEHLSKKHTMTMQQLSNSPNIGGKYSTMDFLSMEDEDGKASVLDDDYDDNDNENENFNLNEEVHFKASLSIATNAKRQSNMIFRHGWLTKQGQKRRNWLGRYFVLFSNGELKYYTKQNISDKNEVLYYDPTSPKFNLVMSNVQENDNLNNINLNLSGSPSNGNGHSNGNGNGNGNSPKNSKDKPDLLSSVSLMTADEINESTSTSMSPLPIGARNGTITTTSLYESKHAPLLSTPARDSPIFSHYNKKPRKLKVLRPRGVIDCNKMIETQFLEFDDPKLFGFAIITSTRTWKFQAKSDLERREWIASIHAVNYGVSAFDFPKLSFDIFQTGNTTEFRRSQNSFLSDMTITSDRSSENVLGADKHVAVQEGWIHKLGEPLIPGLEQNYWKKRWISLYQNPARLIYAQYPTDYKEIRKTLNLNLNLDLKAPSYNLTDMSFNNDDNINNSEAIHESWKMNSNSEFTNPLASIFHTFAQNEEMRRKLANGTYYIKGKILLSDVTDMDYIQDKKLIRKKYRAPTIHVFTLTTPNRVWIFACESKEEVRLWMQRIKYFIPNYKVQQKLELKFKHLFDNNNNNNNNNNHHHSQNNNDGVRSSQSPILSKDSPLLLADKNQSQSQNVTVSQPIKPNPKPKSKSASNLTPNENENETENENNSTTVMNPISLTEAALAMAAQQQLEKSKFIVNHSCGYDNNQGQGVHVNKKRKGELMCDNDDCSNYSNGDNFDYYERNDATIVGNKTKVLVSEASPDGSNEALPIHHSTTNSGGATALGKVLRKASGILESFGLKEEYCTITGVNKKGTYVDPLANPVP